MPRPVTGSAVDPITLEPVDEVVVTTLVDNVYDALLDGDETVIRNRAIVADERAGSLTQSCWSTGC